MNLFEQTPPSRRRYGLAAFIGLIAGIVSAFVKWGAEVPLPPRSPADLFTGACGPEQLIRAAGQIDCSRNFLNPPYVFLTLPMYFYVTGLALSILTQQFIHLPGIYLTGSA